MDLRSINLGEKLSTFSEHWAPKVIAQLNDYQLKVVKFQGRFVWHEHLETDELFLVLDGEMTIHFREGDVCVRAGELFVIPQGVRHMTSATAQCQALLIERQGTVNTGQTADAKTAPLDSWI